jgi:chromate transporter
VGVIAGGAVVLSRRAVADIPTLLIGLGVLFVLLRFKKIPEQLLILGAG